ncbi:MAG: hypothetical protein ACRC6M_13795, partial [Microcystaceae cyanobacterium]
MANKRSRRTKTPKFNCPYCDRRLWRVGTGKHYIYAQGAEEVQAQFNLSKKNAGLLTSQNTVQVDRGAWIEEFFCEVDGKMWLQLTKKEDGEIAVKVADEKHWKRSTRTIDPNKPNPSV